MGEAWTDADGRFNSTRYQHSRVRWSQDVWYGKQRDLFAERRARQRGREHELIAVTEIFPKIGLTDCIDLTALVSNAPFDFLALFGGERIAIDVSVKWQKRVDHKAPLARAMGFPFHLLLVSPRDTSFFFFTKVLSDAKSVRVPFSILRLMAAHFGEDGHGRRH